MSLKTFLVEDTGQYLVVWRIKEYGNQQPPDSKVRGANMGPIRGRQDPGGPHVGPWTLL